MRDRTEALLDVLSETGVPASFFVLGKQIDRFSFATIKRMARDGHRIGNHSYRHCYGMMRRYRYNSGFPIREFLVTQFLVDFSLLSETQKDMDDLCVRVFGKAPRAGRPWSDAWLKRQWASIVDAHGRVLEELPAERRPTPMQYARVPGGGAFLREREAGERRRADSVMRELGMLHVLWQSGTRDSDPRLPAPERYSRKRLVDRLEWALEQGGVCVAHDRMPVRALGEFLGGSATHARAIVSLDAIVAAKYGLPTAEVLAKAARLASVTAPT